MTGHSSDITYFRWLGTAGIEIHFKNKILLIDPYLTREPIKKILFGNLESNKALIKDLIPKADYILITHSHFDHLCDVPTIMSNTDSIAAGSQNTFKILKAAGITDDKFIQIDIEKTVLWPE
jgi:L-ascorbate metabolism protein UlaG (beta-lactamase superfamily)